MNNNWADKTIWTADNLYIMRGMNSGVVDLIYLDPPFNSKTDYAAPIGSKAAGAAFKDTWTLSDVDAEWINLIEARHPALYRVLLAATTPSDKSYLAYMAVRLLEMRRLLKPSGSLYLHCDPTMSHYLKLLLDAVLGRQRFVNEIVWCYSTGGASKSRFARKHDIILFYQNDGNPVFNTPRVPYTSAMSRDDKHSHKFHPDGKIMLDWWTDLKPINPQAKERVGYPTQKPLSLLTRIIKASTNTDDIVFDPFCGCATTLVAADDLHRQWVGIDISDKAAQLVKQRVEEHQGMFKKIIHRTDIPQRTDLGALEPYNSIDNRRKLYGLQDGDCAGCRDHFQSRNLEIDHIIARSKGGTDHLDNLQLLCGHCNRVKGDRGMEYLRVKLQLTS